MEKMPLEMLNAERDKELFEYEMTEVRAALQEEFEKVQNLAPACENIDEVLPPEGVSVQTETVIPDHVDMKKLFLDIQPAEAKAKGAMPDHVDMTNPPLDVQPAEAKAKGAMPDHVDMTNPPLNIQPAEVKVEGTMPDHVDMTNPPLNIQPAEVKVEGAMPDHVDMTNPPLNIQPAEVKVEGAMPDHIDMAIWPLNIQPTEVKVEGAMPDHVDMTNPSLTIQPAEVKAKGIVPDKVEVRVPQYSVKTESLLTVEYRYQPFETMAFEEPDTQRVMEEVSAIQNAMQQSFAAKNEKIAEIMEMEFETPDISGSVADILLSCKENGMKIASGAGAN